MRFLLPCLLAALLTLAACGDENTTVVGGSGQPTISGVSPAAGPPAGGTPITITGGGFQDGATVTVGGTAATGVTFVSAVELTAVTPPGAGAATVVVTNPDGGAVAVVSAFTYATPPSVTAVTPSVFPSSGGTLLTITGSTFSNGATVTVGGAPAVVQSVAPTQITAIAPPGAGGPTSVDVRNADGQTAAFPGARYDDPPVVVASAPAQVAVGEVARFDVSATDPEGQALSLRLLNPPPGCALAPASGMGMAQGTVHWQVLASTAGRQTLLFEAEDAEGLRGRASVAIDVIGGALQSNLQVADVTGDGRLDVIAAARLGDAAAPDAGYIGVWAGQTVPSGVPTAFLRVAAATPGDQLGWSATAGPSLFVADVTGDGVLDIVAVASTADIAATDSGAIYVWAGGVGLVGTLDATARLAVPGASFSALLGSALDPGSGVVCCDVSGDGILDVLACAPFDSVAASAGGAVYMWRGGPTLSGAVAPTATLAVASAGANANIGRGLGGQALLCCDVLGDATPDVIVVAPLADGAASDTGAVFVWAGGASLTGAPAPTASLSVPGAPANSFLGRIDGSQAVLCCDVAGDARLDLVVGAQFASEGVSRSGAVYVFAGGAGLSGATAPTATLVRQSPTAGDDMGYIAGQQGLFCCDVTGDGRPDVIIGGQGIDTTTANAGAVTVWAGDSAMSGTVTETASLERATPVSNDLLGSTGSGVSILCCDVTGDASLDVIVASRLAEISVQDQGLVCVWAGGTGLTGTLAPTATLARPGAGVSDQLGHIPFSQALLCCDVTGDLRDDIVVAGAYVDAAAPDSGAAYVWAGDNALAGTPPPTAELRVSSASTGDQLGYVDGEGGVSCCDVTGDGVADVICGASRADTTAGDAGAVYVWTGGAGLTGTLDPTASLRLDDPQPSDFLGQSGAPGTGSRGILCCDVTGDGVLDLVVGARQADRGAPNSGAVCVWHGGGGLAGPLHPDAIVRRAAPGNSDLLGDIQSGQGILCADVTGDGVPDLVMGCRYADVGGQGDTGAVFVGLGGGALTGTVFPLVLAIENPTNSDRLGE